MEKEAEAKLPSLKVRRANIKDGLVLYKWRNTPQVRKYFKNPEKNSVLKHFLWYLRYLNRRNDGHMFFYFLHAKPCGMIRLDRLTKDHGFEISILVGPQFQARGLGKLLLSDSIRYADSELQVKRVVARINRKNEPSLKLFSAFGFVKYSIDDFYDYLEFLIR